MKHFFLITKNMCEGKKFLYCFIHSIISREYIFSFPLSAPETNCRTGMPSGLIKAALLELEAKNTMHQV